MLYNIYSTLYRYITTRHSEAVVASCAVEKSCLGYAASCSLFDTWLTGGSRRTAGLCDSYMWCIYIYITNGKNDNNYDTLAWVIVIIYIYIYITNGNNCNDYDNNNNNDDYYIYKW